MAAEILALASCHREPQQGLAAHRGSQLATPTWEQRLCHTSVTVTAAPTANPQPPMMI